MGEGGDKSEWFDLLCSKEYVVVSGGVILTGDLLKHHQGVPTNNQAQCYYHRGP